MMMIDDEILSDDDWCVSMFVIIFEVIEPNNGKIDGYKSVWLI